MNGALGLWVGSFEFGLGFVEGDVGDLFLGGGQVDDGLGGWVVAPGAWWGRGRR